MKKLLTLSIPSLAVLLISACTHEQAYNSVKGWQKNECNKRIDNRDREECLKDAGTSYDDYLRETAQ